DEVEALGLGQEVLRRDGDPLAVAAGELLAEDAVLGAQVVPAGQAALAPAARDAGADDDLGADLGRVDAGPHGGDDAGDVAAEHVRERQLEAGQAAADPQVEAVEGAGADLDE